MWNTEFAKGFEYQRIMVGTRHAWQDKTNILNTAHATVGLFSFAVDQRKLGF